MDRSYLSAKPVVEASRKFVCARLITFENPDEHKLMRKLWGTANVNTLFTLMDPTGERRLSRVGRSPKSVFRDADAMAKEMLAVAKRYPGKRRVKAQPALPVLEDVRIALNVTACDAQQLVILRGDDKQTAALARLLAEFAWSEDFIGRFLYARADERTDWSVFDGADKAPKNGLLIVRPDKFGLSGRVVGTFDAKGAKKLLAKKLKDAIASHQPQSVDTRKIRREGRRKGVQWQPEIAPDNGR